MASSNLRQPKWAYSLRLPEGWFNQRLDMTGIMGVGEDIADHADILSAKMSKDLPIRYSQELAFIAEELRTFQDEDSFDRALVLLYNWGDTRIAADTRLCEIISRP